MILMTIVKPDHVWAKSLDNKSIGVIYIETYITKNTYKVYALGFKPNLKKCHYLLFR